MHKRNNKIFFKSCNICNSKNIKAVINLGYHLPSDTFINKVDDIALAKKNEIIKV